MVWGWAVIPACWLWALTKYIPKSGNTVAAEISGHRGIGLRAILGKTFTRILLARLSAITGEHRCPMQLGFWDGMDSMAALWVVRAVVAEREAEGAGVWLLMCDWAKAFDKVWRDLVMLLLHAMGVTGTLWLLVDSWINSTVVVAVFRAVVTPPLELGAGLGQGCVLSAMLFVVFIATLTRSAPPMDDGYPWGALVLRLYEARLPMGAGLQADATAPLPGGVAPAMVSADDTTLLAENEGDMLILCRALERWKYRVRFDANVSKFQLVARDAGSRRMWARGGRIVIDDGVPVSVKPVGKLLGGGVFVGADERALWGTYMGNALRDQLALQRVYMYAGGDAAEKFCLACPYARVIRAAAFDIRLCARGEGKFNAIQRALWAGGPEPAIPARRQCNVWVIQEMIGGLEWDRALAEGPQNCRTAPTMHEQNCTELHRTAQNCNRTAT